MKKPERILIALACLAIIYQFAVVPAWNIYQRKAEEMERAETREWMKEHTPKPDWAWMTENRGVAPPPTELQKRAE